MLTFHQALLTVILSFKHAFGEKKNECQIKKGPKTIEIKKTNFTDLKFYV